MHKRFLSLIQIIGQVAGHRTAGRFSFALCIVLLSLSSVSAADSDVDLALKQSQIADRYRQLETMMLKMAEYDSNANPRRAALLRQALTQVKDRQVDSRLEELVTLFRREQLQKAIDGQQSVNLDLKALLQLLLSEDRPDGLKNSQARVRSYIKRLDRIIRQQKSIEGQTEGGGNTERLAKDQEKVADTTDQLGKEIDEAEGTSPPEEDLENSEPSQGADKTEDSGSSEESGEGSPNGDNPDGKNSKGDSSERSSEGGQSSGDGAAEQTDRTDENGSSEQDTGSDESRNEPGGGQENADDEEKSAGESEDQGQQNQGQQGQGQQNQGQQSQGQQSQGQQSQGQQSQGQQNQGQPNQGQPNQGQPNQGQQNQGQQNQGQQNQGQESAEQAQPQFPGRKRIAAAEDRMRQAKQDLEEADREGAKEKQEEARRLLELAKAELEEILRQLREEEIERVLALLEGRFRKMLEMELRIQDTTIRLNRTPAAKRTRQFTVRSGKLSQDQRKVILEIDKALTLLREEGSSVAFPEAASQMRADMEMVARRVNDEKLGDFTQAVEADIVAALEEMIAALQIAQKEAEERRQQQQQQRQQQQQADPSNQALVNQIAELKMIRALQMRVNTRTQNYAKLLADAEDPVGQAIDEDLADSIRELSDRQERIHRVTSDIIQGKNK